MGMNSVPKKIIKLWMVSYLKVQKLTVFSAEVKAASQLLKEPCVEAHYLQSKTIKNWPCAKHSPLNVSTLSQLLQIVQLHC